MEHRGKTKPSCFFKSDSKVAQTSPIITKAAEWEKAAEAGEPSGVSFRPPRRSNADQMCFLLLKRIKVNAKMSF